MSSKKPNTKNYWLKQPPEMFLKISQKSQEKTGSHRKASGLQACNFMNCFCWESNIFLIIDRNIFKIFIGKDCFLAGICQSIANGNINHNVPLRNEKCKSSHQRRSIITGVLENFAKFTGKHVCQSLFFNKVAGPRSVT